VWTNGGSINRTSIPTGRRSAEVAIPDSRRAARPHARFSGQLSRSTATSCAGNAGLPHIPTAEHTARRPRRSGLNMRATREFSICGAACRRRHRALGQPGILKPRAPGKEIPWHQDGQYWRSVLLQRAPYGSRSDDATPENGCMRYIPGCTPRQHLPASRETSGAMSCSPGSRAFAVRRVARRDDALKAGQFSICTTFNLIPRFERESFAEASRRLRDPLHACYFGVRAAATTSTCSPHSFSMSNRPIWLLRGRTAAAARLHRRARQEYVLMPQSFGRRGSEARPVQSGMAQRGSLRHSTIRYQRLRSVRLNFNDHFNLDRDAEGELGHADRGAGMFADRLTEASTMRSEKPLMTLG